MNDYELAKALFPKASDIVAEATAGTHRTTQVRGWAASDSEDGLVSVLLDAVAGGEEAVMVVPTTGGISEGSEVLVTLLDGTPVDCTQMGSIDSVGTLAQTAWNWADDAYSAATSAQTSAGAAATAAENAQRAADSAQGSADQALLDAAAASTAAGAAQSSANAANAAASAALTQLSIVEDVSGTLDWISKHGTYAQTSDTTVQAGTVYFEKVGSDYVPIASPDPEADPHDEGWYVLDVTDSQSDYIMAHLAVTGAGLWVLTSGIDGQTAATSSGYKVLLSGTGMTVYDGSGSAVATYGSSITFSGTRAYSIGDEDAYIVFDGNGHITIGGAVTLGGTRTLSQLLAAYDTAALSVVIESSAGTGFVNQTGSTTLTCRVYQYGDQELDSAGTSFSYLWSTGATTKSITVSAPSVTATYTCDVEVTT